MENAKCIPKTDKRIRRTRRRGLILSLDYEIEVRDKNGKLVSKCKGRNDAFVKNYIQMLQCLTRVWASDSYQLIQVTLTNTAGVGETYDARDGTGVYWGHLSYYAPTNTDSHGVQVGTSDVAFDKAQFSLQGKIAHGTGAGQLVYSDTTIEAVADEDTSSRFRIIRSFTNSSGGAITVKEIGIATFVRRSTTPAHLRYWLVARDVLSSPQVVPDGNTLTVRYRLFISYA